ncbi:unnamed protein product [Urochloa decumbens]|uniref:Rab3 GTPase-activating protein catalytic subunit n=1 Tax=Urochloa decumbens TaxID=240449 RepID=A0ABC9HDP7_9POAL
MQKGAESVPSFENLYMIKRELKHGKRVYSMEYHFMKSAKGKNTYWDDDTHSMQLSFGVDEFLMIAPLSASGVVLDDPESTKLLSSVAIALSNCGSNWPAFVPVHDPSRKAYIGIQNLGTVFTRRFEADRIGSQVPIRLMHLEGLHELFLSKFVLSSTDFPARVKVHFSMKLTYRTPEYDYDNETLDSEATESLTENEVASHPRKQWDDDCPWAEWYSAEDPVKGFELTAIWGERAFEETLEMAEVENASSFDADGWFLHPVVSQYMVDDSIGKFVGFASQLHLLVNAYESSAEAQFLEDFVTDTSGQDNSKSTTTVPPPSVIDRVMKDLFSDEAGNSNYMEAENKYSRAMRGAPADSLFGQFCLHSLWFGNCNIRAIAVLWIDFVREIRWCWEESERLPRMKSSSSIDLSSCLIHQKLQMLAICIERKKSLNREKGAGHKDETSNTMAVNKTRKGSAGVVPKMMLLNTKQEMHAPYTQDAPLMTEDMHEERLHAAEAFGNAIGLSGQLERDILSSDMSAFKAANPDAVFEDFIRWHSPGDWVSQDKADGNSGWPPKGKLSQRMSEHGNMWRKIWNDAPPLPVSEQKSLLDPVREGEKVLHYLETLRPHQLLEQMVCTAFKSSADILNKTTYGGFKLMKTKMDQLYATLASTLKSLPGSS